MRNESFKYCKITGPAVLGPWVMVGDLEGIIAVLSVSDGSFVGKGKTDGSQILTNPIVVGDKTVVQTSKGNLYTFAVDQNF